MPLTSRTADWLKPHNAFVLLLLTGRRLRKLIAKYDPDQPRAPAGRPDGGRWVRVGDGGGSGGGGGGGIGGGFPLPDLGLAQELYLDETGEAPWDIFLNSYTEDDGLAAQVVVNEDDSVTTTEWDTGGVERWVVRQTLTDADRAVVTKTDLGHDGTGQITFGPGADGKLVLAAADGQFDLVPARGVPEPQVVVEPTQGDVLKPVSDGVVRVISSGAAAGAGAFVVGMTAFPSPAGGQSFVPLADDVRLAFQDNGRLPVVQERINPSWTDFVTGGTWRTLTDVPVAEGPAGTLTIGGDALRNAIGQERFDALGQLDGRGIPLSMQPAPVAPRDVPADSIFGGDRPTGLLHSPQGTVVDWAAPYARAGEGQRPVLELRPPGPQGLTWEAGKQPIIGPLNIGDVDRACPRYSDVHQVAVETDMSVRAANPGLSARDLGTLIHREIAKEINRWPEIDAGIWSEQGVLVGFAKRGAFLPPGSSRIDVLEDAGWRTVCVYDPKTGDGTMSQRQMLRYWQEALVFRPGTMRIFVIPIYTKR
jgi:hypothetical protein